MRVTTETSSITGRVRREQIVRAATSVIAELGLAKASFARIAEKAGVASTRMISYHFRDRDDLVRGVVSAAFAEAGEEIEGYLESTSSPAEQLRGLIEGNIRWFSARPEAVAALAEIWHSHRQPDGQPAFGFSGHDLEFAMVGQIFAAGQAAGEFGAFDPRTMAVLLRYALNGAADMVVAEPGTDVDALVEEVTATFLRATSP